MEFISFNKISVNNYIVSYEDEQICRNINELIIMYEKQNDIEIQNICFYIDNDVEYTYNNIWCSGDINLKAFYPDWSRKNVLEYYTKRKFNIIEKNEGIEKNFLNKNWTSFDDEQVILIEDTAHICIF